jgi:hypothetical protein
VQGRARIGDAFHVWSYAAVCRSAQYYKFSHRLVRLTVMANLIALALTELSSDAYRFLRQAHLGSVMLVWFVASSFILLMYVLAETLWMLRDDLRERRAILIDACFAATWFAVWWGGVLYTLTHTVWL